MLGTPLSLKSRLPLPQFYIHLVGRILLVLNAIGAVVYLFGTSHSWAIPPEHGLVPITGEPIVWALFAFPILAAFFLLNLIWGIVVLVRKERSKVRLWLWTVPIWIVAVGIDFYHH
jgi:hypothetical protein